MIVPPVAMATARRVQGAPLAAGGTSPSAAAVGERRFTQTPEREKRSIGSPSSPGTITRRPGSTVNRISRLPSITSACTPGTVSPEPIKLRRKSSATARPRECAPAVVGVTSAPMMTAATTVALTAKRLPARFLKRCFPRLTIAFRLREMPMLGSVATSPV